MTNIANSFKRLDELDSAIDWGLTRNPKNFQNLKQNYHIWVMDKLPFGNFPRLRIIYNVDDKNERITLIDVDNID